MAIWRVSILLTFATESCWETMLPMTTFTAVMVPLIGAFTGLGS